MEGITLFVSIVIIVFGILQIILFFKLWGMTNDVKKIRKTKKRGCLYRAFNFHQLRYRICTWIFCRDIWSRTIF